MATRVRILSAARALCDEGGVDTLSMRRIAGAVGITAPALYRHFHDKDHLLDAIAEAGFELLDRQLATVRRARTPEGRIRGLLDRYLDFALIEPRLFEVMFLLPRRGARRFPRDFAAGRSPA